MPHHLGNFSAHIDLANAIAAGLFVAVETIGGGKIGLGAAQTNNGE